MWRIEFAAAKFLPYLPEACQTNPGVYGFELAYWLSKVLAHQGLVTSYPQSEDWGWFIEYVEGDQEIMIGCGCEAHEGDGYTGRPIEWRIFVRASLSWMQRFGGGEESPVLARLVELVTSALRAEGVSVQVEEA